MEKSSSEWRPDWPAWLWVLPFAAAVVAPVVARSTNGNGCDRHVSSRAWALVALSAALTAFLTYAFSRRRGAARTGIALLAGALAFGVVLAVTATIALVGYACGGE